MFLKLDGIEGEAQDGWIEIESWSWGASNHAATGGAGAGKVSFSDLTVMKKLDKATPLILDAALSGQNIPFGMIKWAEVAATGTTRWRFEKWIELRADAFKQDANAHGGSTPTE